MHKDVWIPLYIKVCNFSNIWNKKIFQSNPKKLKLKLKLNINKKLKLKLNINKKLKKRLT